MKNNESSKTNLCNICPRGCKIDRRSTRGFCNENDTIKIAKIIEHFCWEEPCLSKDMGTLAIFFSGCNLRCDYCQNYEISRGGVGKEYSIDEFVKLIEEKQKDHDSIDLITPTHFSLPLSKAFKKIKKLVPVIWNTNSYETIQNIGQVSKFVDVFLADLKYANDSLGKKFSLCNDYATKTIDAIEKMCELKPDIESDGFLSQGVIIRHLVLPGHVENSIKVLDIIKELFPNRKVSIMSQFTPNGKSKLDRKITPLEYKVVVAHLEKIGLENGFIQDFDSASSQFVPKFD